MTALQEIAQLKGELDRVKAESGLVQQTADNASNQLSALATERDALVAEVSSLRAENVRLAEQAAQSVASADAALKNIEARAAQMAAQQLAAVGVTQPVRANDTKASTKDEVLAAYKSADAAGKRKLYLAHSNFFSV